MLASLRRFTSTWPAKVFFVVLVGSFALWGVADVVRNGFGSGVDANTVAMVGPERIDPQELQEAARRMLTQMQRQTGSTAAPTPEMRRGVTEQALQQLVIQAAFAAEVAKLNVQVSDDALRRATFETRAFQGPGGQFDRATFQSVLRNNGFTEARYLKLLRTDVAQRQLVEAVRAGGYSPDQVNRLVFTFQGETRTADLVTLPFAAASEPRPPTEAELERQYDDNANQYRAPEYRRIKAVILSPERLAQDITVSDDEARAYFASHKADFGRAETRSVQVVVAQTEDAAKQLAKTWLLGADWDAIQKQAAAVNASALALDDTALAAFPSPDLAKPVFAAPANAVTGPVSAEGSWAVFRVTKIAGGSDPAYESLVSDIKTKVALEQATDQVYDRANKVQDLLAGGAKLDELPAGLGLAAVTGTLDAQGMTPDGEPAPIPAAPALRQALITKAFALGPNDPATLDDGGDHAFFAVVVESTTPPAQRPLEEVRDRVRDDWIREARRHEQDVTATGLLTAVNDGATLQDAAARVKQPVTRTPPIGRSQPPPTIAPQLVQPLFATAAGHATVVETPSSFIVAVPVTIAKPDVTADPAGLERVRSGLAKAMSDDLEMTYAAALRDREKVVVNRPVLDSIAQ